MSKKFIPIREYPFNWGPYDGVELIPSEQVDTEMLQKAMESIYLEGDGAVYTLMVGGKEAGQINIPSDTFLSSVSYDVANQELVFNFSDEEASEIRIKVSDFIKMYEAGDGLALTENKFSVMLDPASQAYIEIGADGVKIIGIDEAFAALADVYQPKGDYLTEVPAEYVTKEEMDAEGFAKSEQVAEDIAALADLYQPKGDYLTEIPAEYVTKEEMDAEGFAKAEQVDEAIAALGDVYQPKGDYLTEIPAEYVKDDEVSEAIAALADVYQPKGEYASEQSVNDMEGNVAALLARIDVLEERVSNQSKTNIDEIVDPVSANISDATKDIVVSSTISNDEGKTISVSGKTVTLSGASVENGTKVIFSGNDVEIKESILAGDFYPTSTATVAMQVNNAEYVTFKNMTFAEGTHAYNGININSEVKGVIFENCKFLGTYANTPVSFYKHKEGAVFTFNNCYFEECSNPIRFFNDTNHSCVVNITNSECKTWETKTPEYGGLIICEDRFKDEDATAANRFGDGKIVINLTNVTTPYGLLTKPANMSEILGSKDSNQIVYVYYHNGGFVEYDANKYPIVNIY